MSKWRATHKARIAQYSRKWLERGGSAYYYRDRTRIKIDVLTHYGNGKCACVKCGFDNLDALCLDHINDDGYKSRNPKYSSRSNASGIHFYYKLRKGGFPSGYQTLCANCNQIKWVNLCRERRKCPQEKKNGNLHT